jgi:hypothetical protein
VIAAISFVKTAIIPRPTPQEKVALPHKSIRPKEAHVKNPPQPCRNRRKLLLLVLFEFVRGNPVQLQIALEFPLLRLMNH